MYFKSGVSRQHHQGLWQNCGIVTGDAGTSVRQGGGEKNVEGNGNLWKIKKMTANYGARN